MFLHLAAPSNPDDVLFQLAIEIINYTNRPLKINDLFTQAISRLGMTPAQANASIFNLLKKKMLVEGSKLTQNDVLRNPLRASMYDHVSKNPGSRVRDIRRAMGIDNAESAWHLKVLEKFGFVRCKRFGKYLSYYPTTLADESYDEILCMLRQDTAYRVFYDIYVQPNSNVVEIGARVSVDPSTVRYHADKLVNTALVQEVPDPTTNQSRYSVNTDMWAYILTISPGFSG